MLNSSNVDSSIFALPNIIGATFLFYTISAPDQVPVIFFPIFRFLYSTCDSQLRWQYGLSSFPFFMTIKFSFSLLDRGVNPNVSFPENSFSFSFSLRQTSTDNIWLHCRKKVCIYLSLISRVRLNIPLLCRLPSSNQKYLMVGICSLRDMKSWAITISQQASTYGNDYYSPISTTMHLREQPTG